MKSYCEHLNKLTRENRTKLRVTLSMPFLRTNGFFLRPLLTLLHHHLQIDSPQSFKFKPISLNSSIPSIHPQSLQPTNNYMLGRHRGDGAPSRLKKFQGVGGIRSRNFRELLWENAAGGVSRSR